jgi:magnesium-transporting ATPase (P-type)
MTLSLAEAGTAEGARVLASWAARRRAVEALHERIRHTALTLPDGRAVAVELTELVPGDLVRLGVGNVVAADRRPGRGRIRFGAALGLAGRPPPRCSARGCSATRRSWRTVGWWPATLDEALWAAVLGADSPGGLPVAGPGGTVADGEDPLGGARRLAVLPFDYHRRLASALVAERDGTRRLVAKGAPEAVLTRCLPYRPAPPRSSTGCSPPVPG